ncbi:MAG: phosphatase PAP2 family protein [Actinomycetes bacterium]
MQLIRTPEQQSASRPLRARALRTLIGCVGAFTLLWLVFIQTEAGRRFGNSAWSGRRALPHAVRAMNDSALRTITTTSLAAGCVALLVVGLLRRRFVLGIAAVAVVAASTLSAEFLKRFVITRPPTPGEVLRISGNSFPSGHATITTSLALAAIMLTPHRWRRIVAVGLSLAVTFQTAGVLAAGWHRPSDALSGYAIALGWASVAVWLLARMGRVTAHGGELAGTEVTTRLFIGAGVVTLSGLAVAALTPHSAAPENALALVLATATIDVVGVAVVWWFWRLLRDWTLDPSNEHPDHSERIEK